MLRNLFYIVKHDRQTLLCLFVVFLATIVLFFGGDSQPPTAITSADSSSQAVALQRSPKSEGGYAVKGKTVRLTSFDPNTADSTQLLALGLTPWQVRNIYRYRAAGGVYTCPEDFAQLYGLTVKKYRELLPYIRISDDYRMAADVYKRPSRHYGYMLEPISVAHSRKRQEATRRLQQRQRKGVSVRIQRCIIHRNLSQAKQFL